MKGLVLAAGKGSRLSELNLRHKGFAVVREKHVINYSLDLLVGEDETNPLVSEIVIVVGHNAQTIVDAIGGSYRGVSVKYVYQHDLKGVAHAILTAKEALSDDFILCLADEVLLNPNLKGMIEDFHRTDAICMCGAFIDGNDRSGNPNAYIVDEDGVIIKVTEKPQCYPNDIRGVGECIFKKECLEFLPAIKPNPVRGDYELGDFIQMAADSGKARVFHLADAYVNVNYAKDIDTANKMLK